MSTENPLAYFCPPDLISHLENAANICLGPPDLVNSERRREAEEIFVSFRKMKNPFALCKFILESCRVDYVLFQTAVLLREAVAREWNNLDKSSVDQMLNYLLNFVLEKNGLQPYVQQQVVQDIAVIVKRGTVEGWNTREEILNKVSQLISSGDMTMQLIGCCILRNLLSEYASTFASSDIGLNWETHFMAKHDFEASHLKRTFQFCIQILNEVENAELSNQLLTFLRSFLSIAEQILTWNFLLKQMLPRKIVGIFESDHAPFLRPGPCWRSLLLDEKILQLFFKIHWKIRHSPEVAHHSLNCLIQLASLNGNIFVANEDRVQYLNSYLTCFMNSFAANELFEHEVLGTVAILNKLVMVFPPTLMLNLPPNALKLFLSKITAFTCHTACAAAKEQACGDDDRVYSEGFDRLLEAWSTFMNDEQFPLNEEGGLSATKVFDTYLMCHLSPPQGTRPIMEIEAVDEMQDFNEDDRSKFKDQLFIIGMISRRALSHTLPLLIKLLEEKTNLLSNYFEKLAEQPNCSGDQVLSNLYEDIHWLVLLTGNTLFAQSDGDSILIPNEIVEYSIQQTSTVDIGVSLQVLTSPHLAALDVDKCESSADRVIS